jgi:DNA-binding beta-propeller fold protein YncE
VKFLYAFREPKNLGIRISALERLWEVIAGEDDRGMVRPYAVAVAGQRVAVADPGLRAVHLFDLEEEDYEQLVDAGEENLRSPVGVAMSPDKVFVADSALAKVFMFDWDGDLLGTIGGMERPTGLAYDRARGRLYVTDTLAHQIVIHDDAGNRLFAFGKRGAGDGDFNFPSHIYLWQDRLYVNDTMNFRLQIFDLDGNHLSSFGKHGDGSGSFAQPKGVALDREGHVYVADALFDRVQIFDAEGNFLLAFGDSGRNVGAFWLPAGIFIENDSIYVADAYNRRVQVFQFLGGS